MNIFYGTVIFTVYMAGNTWLFIESLHAYIHYHKAKVFAASIAGDPTGMWTIRAYLGLSSHAL